ncbi:MAG: hypothetical protein LPK38_04135, partial [Actinomycetes bacterium]|nr:hypothetical protein [Actinomycetes bacterium]MDX5380480.1 hypothetical protein [Actinomycetes bacterium]MDX5399330.1 hypothetical protein [Actinomycetes bacterium]MDX5450215.1 hypothetical protein [Actinomycetes bacterium]
DDGLPVMIHEGGLVRGDLLPVVERLRALEGGFDDLGCDGGDHAPGTYTPALMVQVWEGDPSRVVATYVNPGLGGDPRFTLDDTGVDIALAGDDAARERKAEYEARVAAEGVPIVDVGAGTRAPELLESEWATSTPSCLRAAAAPRLDQIRVIPGLDEDTSEVRFGTIEILEGFAAGTWPGVTWPKRGPAPDWGRPLFRATLLLYDESGALVSVFESDAWIGQASAGGSESWVDVAHRNPGCATPAALPAQPGRYTPVYVYDLPDIGTDGRGSGMAPDGWYVLPSFYYDGDPASLASGLVLEDENTGVLVLL